MNNLKTALKIEAQNKLNEFKQGLNNYKSIDEVLKLWQYNDLIPKTNKKEFQTFADLSIYLQSRKEKQLNKTLLKDLQQIELIEQAQDIEKITISIEWKKSKMWGNNPSAEAKVFYKNGICERFYSGSIGGCGYDKESTAVANSLNQCNSVLKLLYNAKNEALEGNYNHETNEVLTGYKSMKNHDLLGYGSGYGLLPSIEGGVGVSCYNAIFNKVGFNFKTLTSGKNFDVFVIEKTAKK
jgi:hypothetical protein